MYTKILVPLDGSEFAECVLPYVQWFARVSNVNEIVFLRVVEPLHMYGGLESTVLPKEKQHIEHDSIELATNYLDQIAGQFKEGKFTVRPVVASGKPGEYIPEYVTNNNIDLIIMATHGFSGLHRWVRGSIADSILHAATVPIFLVTPRDRPPDK
jgi:nucleotide-binding universal stress UspA family protein